MSNNQPWIDMEHIRGSKPHANDTSGRIHSRKNSAAYKKSGKTSSGGNKNHVVVKITGGAKSPSRARGKMEYDSRDNPNEIYFNDGEIIDLDTACTILDADFEKADIASRSYSNDSKMTYNMVFSMPDKTDEESLKGAVADTLKSHFGDKHNYFYTLHNDTKNNHVHVTVSKASLDKSGKNLHLDKSLLNNVKSDFAKNLNKRGIKAEFNSHTDELTTKQREKAAESRRFNRELADTYRVLDYGHEKYQNKQDGAPSYFVHVVSLKGVEKTLWSKGLEPEINGKNIAVGETIKIKKESASMGKQSRWFVDRHKVDGTELLRGKILKAGAAKHMNKSNGKLSYNVAIQDETGNIHQFWSKDLKTAFDKSGIKAGDSVEFIKARDKNGIEHPKFRKVDPATVKMQPKQQPEQPKQSQSSGFKM